MFVALDGTSQEYGGSISIGKDCNPSEKYLDSIIWFFDIKIFKLNSNEFSTCFIIIHIMNII